VNPDQATLNLPVGTVSASVALAGTTDPVIGPADVAVQDGVLTIVYAWGSAEEGNLDLAVQTITVGHTAPRRSPLRNGRIRRGARRDDPRRSGSSDSRSHWPAASVVVIVARRTQAAKIDR
jgi:hypothetical protein